MTYTHTLTWFFNDRLAPILDVIQSRLDASKKWFGIGSGYLLDLLRVAANCGVQLLFGGFDTVRQLD